MHSIYEGAVLTLYKGNFFMAKLDKCFTGLLIVNLIFIFIGILLKIEDTNYNKKIVERQLKILRVQDDAINLYFNRIDILLQNQDREIIPLLGKIYDRVKAK